MTSDKLHEHMSELLKAVEDMMEAGQKEYANDEDVFGNFNRLAGLLKTDRKKVLLTYSMKHMDGIFSYVNGHVSQRESVHGRIIDKIVYMVLLSAMIAEEQREG